MRTLSFKDKKTMLSILSQHQFLFGLGAITYDSNTREQTSDLLRAVENSQLNSGNIYSIVSIIRQHSLIFGEGLISSDQNVISEDKKLIQKLYKLLHSEEKYIPTIIPRVNYLNYKRNLSKEIEKRKLIKEKPDPGGYPLFGKKRIALRKISKGYLILFNLPKNYEKPSMIFVHIISIKHSESIHYENEKVVILTKNYIHTILISNKDINEECKYKKISRTAFNVPLSSNNLLAISTKTNFNICISGTPHDPAANIRLKSNPSNNEYSYFFPASNSSFPKIDPFLTNLIKYITKISQREADNISYFITRKIFRENQL